MFIGVSLQQYRKEVAIRLSAKYNKLWVTAEVFLFVLVGATVNINYLENIVYNNNKFVVFVFM
jgi:NhaP-type Na+/H+ or K+/H+ antiporter